MRLRAFWRASTGDPERSREAIELLDTMGPRTGTAAVLVMRARAAAQAGYGRGAVTALFELITQIQGVPALAPLAAEALKVAEGLPADSAPPGQLEALRRGLRRLAQGPRARG